MAGRHERAVASILFLRRVGTARLGGKTSPRRARRTVCIGLLFLLAAVLAQAQSPASAADHNVVIVVIDGARYTETFGDPLHRYIPHIWNLLRPQGTIHTNVYNRGQTVTLGAHATMLTGNECWLDQGRVAPPYTEGDLSRPFTPTLFEHYRAVTGAPATKAWMIANHTAFLEGVTYSRHPQYGAAYAASWHLGPGSDYKMWSDLKEIMDQHQPELVFINLHQTDKYAHAGSWRKYVSHIATADRVVYELWRKIQRHPFYRNRTTLLVTNDHGRHTTDFTNHGDCCEGCQHVMLLALGPGISRGHEAGAVERGLQDIAATVGWLMDLPLPYAVDGNVMDELLATQPDPGPPLGLPDWTLQVSTVTSDAEGQPCDTFLPGDVVYCQATVCNRDGDEVCIYQKTLMLDTCHRGDSDEEEPIWLAPDECTTDAGSVRLPESLASGEWSVSLEVRGLAEGGNVVMGADTIHITVEAP